MVESEMLQAALYYASLGWHVFPCRYGRKVPHTDHGYKDATTDEVQIRKWWTKHPKDNIGIALEPSRLHVLDVDVSPDAHGQAKPGAQSLARHLQLHPNEQITHTLQQRTGSGGMHYFYQRAVEMQPHRTQGWRPGIDNLSDGYAVVAPSVVCAELDDLEHGVAPSRRYEWQNGEHPVRAELLPVAPPSLQLPGVPKPAQVSADGTRQIPDGQRHQQLTKHAVAMRDMGLERDAMRAALHAMNLFQCNPPMPDAEADFEISKIVEWTLGNVRVRRDLIGSHGLFDALVDSAPKPDLKPRQSVMALEAVRFREKLPTRYLSGYHELDVLTRGGFMSHGLSMINGAPGSGKTAMVLTMAHQMCAHVPVYFVSTELQYPELVARLTCKTLDKDADELVAATEDSPLLGMMEAALLGKRIHLTSSDDLRALKAETLPFIKNEIIRLRSLYGVAPFVVVDYLQQVPIAIEGKFDDRTRVSAIAEALADMARDLGCAILATGQVSRADYKEPSEATIAEAFMGSGKHSGDLEYHTIFNAMLVTSPQRGYSFRPATLYVAKQRMAPAGNVLFTFQGSRFFFETVKASDIAKTKQSQAHEDEQRIVNFIKMETARGQVWTKIKLIAAVPGLSRRRAKDLIDAMLLQCKLVQKEYKPEGKNKKPIQIIAVAEHNGHAGPTLDIASALSAILDGKQVLQ